MLPIVDSLSGLEFHRRRPPGIVARWAAGTYRTHGTSASWLKQTNATHSRAPGRHELFTGRGDGNFNNFRGPDDRLFDCDVTVDRRGQVTVTFQNDRRSRSTFTGRLTRFDRDLIVADMSGRGVRGSMEIRLNGRDRVTEISMSASGRERFELRWRR